jgi:hypothetical protein
MGRADCFGPRSRLGRRGQVGEPFDLRTVADGYFVGDEGLVASGESFIPFLSAATAPRVGNSTSIYVRVGATP